MNWVPSVTRNRIVQIVILGGIFILMAIGLRSCILSVVSPKPWRIGAVLISEKQMTLTLWVGSMQEAFIQPYDGVYRILEVSQADMPSRYYDMPSAFTGDQCSMEIYWYPSNNLVRLKDLGFADSAGFRSECLLDLNERVMLAVIRGSGVTHIAQLSKSKDELDFPQSHNEERVAHSYSGKVSDLSPSSTATVMIGTQESRPIYAAWTTNSGVLIGVIADKK